MHYHNDESMKRQIALAKPAVDAKPSNHYLKEKVAAPERYTHTRGREMENLRKENNRLFGRLLNIYEVSIIEQTNYFLSISKHLALLYGCYRKNPQLLVITDQDP